MAIAHAASGQLIDVQPLADGLSQARTTALFKTGALEVMRLVVPAHKSVPAHQVRGEVTVQCLEGSIRFNSDGKDQLLVAGDMLYLAGGVVHSLTGVEDACALVHIVLRK